ncbi:MAG: hypothetical protein ABIS86_24260, partial [Streptosporangiaceae bacterium]
MELTRDPQLVAGVPAGTAYIGHLADPDQEFARKCRSGHLCGGRLAEALLGYQAPGRPDARTP